MSTDAPNRGAKPASWKPLAPNPRRVLGVLIEKAKTTPAAYPMSVQAIVSGCNQKSNREPPMTLTDEDVEQALRDLEVLGAVEEIDWIGRVNKYRHKGYEWLGVNRTEMAVMAELLLRGEQSLGDLRVRAARMESIADLDALKPVVDALVQRGLAIELTPPGRGQIVGHALFSAPELAALRSRYAGGVPRVAGDEPAPSGAPRVPPVERSTPAPPRVAVERTAARSDRLAELSAGVAGLRADVASLREQVADLTRRAAAKSRGEESGH